MNFIIEHIDFIASVFGLTCVFLAGRNSKYNFWVGYVYTAALFLLFYKNNLYASLMLQPVSLLINIVGHYRWTHPKEEERTQGNKLAVSMLCNRDRVFCVLSVFMIAAVWGWLLDALFPQDPHPYLDSCVTVLILTAQLLSALKKWDCWIAWLVVNISQIILHITIGNPFMTVVSGLYLANGIWSLITWFRLYKDKK